MWNFSCLLPTLQLAPTDRLRRSAAVLAAPVVELAAVKPASFRMAGFVMVDAAGAVVRLAVLHDRQPFDEAYLTDPS